MGLGETPDWLPQEFATCLHTWTQYAILHRARSAKTKLGPDELRKVERQVMAEVYAAIDAQVTIAENKQATEGSYAKV